MSAMIRIESGWNSFMIIPEKMGVNKNDHIYDKGKSAEIDAAVRVSFTVRKSATDYSLMKVAKY